MGCGPRGTQPVVTQCGGSITKNKIHPCTCKHDWQDKLNASCITDVPYAVRPETSQIKKEVAKTMIDLDFKLTMYIPDAKFDSLVDLLPDSYTVLPGLGYWKGTEESVVQFICYGDGKELAWLASGITAKLLVGGESAVLAELSPVKATVFDIASAIAELASKGVAY